MEFARTQGTDAVQAGLRAATPVVRGGLFRARSHHPTTRTWARLFGWISRTANAGYSLRTRRRSGEIMLSSIAEPRHSLGKDFGIHQEEQRVSGITRNLLCDRGPEPEGAERLVQPLKEQLP